MLIMLTNYTDIKSHKNFMKLLVRKGKDHGKKVRDKSH